MFNVRVCGIAASAAFIISLLLGLIARSSFPAFIIRPILFAVVFFVLSALINIIVNRYLPDLLDEGVSSSPVKTEKFTMPGEHINISEEGMPDSDAISGTVPVLNAAVADDSDGNLGDIASIDDAPDGGDAAEFQSGAFQPVSLETMTFKTKGLDRTPSGLDQKADDDYTTGGGFEDFAAGFDAFTGSGEPDASPDQKPSEVSASGSSARGVASGFGGDSISSGSMDILPDLDGLAKAFSSGSEESGETSDYQSDDFSDTLVKKTSSRSKGKELNWDFNPKDMAAGIRTKISKEG